MEKSLEGLENKVLLRPMEAAAALGVGRTKLYELLNSADFPVVRIGRCVRVPVDDLKLWKDRHVVMGVGNGQS
jgi:excisionase family DNA binding protein